MYIAMCWFYKTHCSFDVGVDGQTVTIVTDPAGVPVDGQNNTFDYPILTSVTLMCLATAADGSPANVTSYHWNVIDCYVDSGDYPCFYSGNKTGQNITGENPIANDAGTVSCTAIIDGTNYTSDPLTLRISGELYIIMKVLLVSMYLS